MRRSPQLPPFPGLFVLLLGLGGLGSPEHARFLLCLGALLCAGLLWWGLEALQGRLQARRYTTLLRHLRAFAERLHVGSLSSVGFYSGGSLEITGHWRGVMVRLQASRHPGTLRLEVWTQACPSFDVESDWRGLRGLDSVPAAARADVRALLTRHGFDWIVASPTALTAACRLDRRRSAPDAIEAALTRLVDLATRCPPSAPRPAPAYRARPSSGVRCPYCHDALDDGSPQRSCRCCGTRYHGECFRAGGCAVLGCAGRWRALPVGAARR